MFRTLCRVAFYAALFLWTVTPVAAQNNYYRGGERHDHDRGYGGGGFALGFGFNFTSTNVYGGGYSPGYGTYSGYSGVYGGVYTAPLPLPIFIQPVRVWDPYRRYWAPAPTRGYGYLVERPINRYR